MVVVVVVVGVHDNAGVAGYGEGTEPCNTFTGGAGGGRL